MRRPTVAVVLVALGGLLASLSGSPSAAVPSIAQPVAIAHPGGDDGNFYIAPEEYFVGDDVKLTANFPNDAAFTDVTFYIETSPGSDDYEAFENDEANKYGNAIVSAYEVTEKADIFALAPNGMVTEIQTLDPTIVDPGSCAVSGSLYIDPSFVTVGQKVKLTANFASDQAGADVTFFSKIGAEESVIDTDDANSSGNAYLYDYEVEEAQEIYAVSSKGACSPTVPVDPVETDSNDFPDAFPESGTISTKPSKVYDGRTENVVANFPSDQAGATVTLFKFRKKNGGFEVVGEDDANSSGNAYIEFEFDGSDTLFALSDEGVRTPVKEFTPAAPNDVTGGPSTLGRKVIYVTTNSGGTPKTKGVDYEAKAVLVSDGEASETYDLETIAVRGNSSADKPKKPYKMKFDKNEEPFGLAKEKTFILLANYGDWTLIRSMVAWTLGMELDGLRWTPDSVFAELFINGKYLGSYQMVESIKIDENRANINPATGQIIEFDPHWKEDGVPGMKGKSGVHYAWKDPDEFKTLDEDDCDVEVHGEDCDDPEGLTNQKISAMKQRIRDFEDVLYGPEGNRNWKTYEPSSPASDWTTYLDMDSAIDYYLAREFTKDNDADMYRSNFFYTNDVGVDAVDPNNPDDPDKFFMGPIWDFDRSAGAKDEPGSTTVSEPTGWWMRGNGSQNHDTNTIHWYTRITDDPRFLEALDQRWAATRQHFEAVGPHGVSSAVRKLGGGTGEQSDADYALGKKVAANDRKIWSSYGGRYHAKTSSYTGELSWVRNWYSERFEWMDEQLTD